MLKTRHGAIGSVVLFAGSGVSFLFTWAGADLGCVRCDCRFRLLEGPWECRWPAVYSVVADTLFLMGVGAVVWTMTSGWCARRRHRSARAET